MQFRNTKKHAQSKLGKDTHRQSTNENKEKAQCKAS